MAGEVSGNTDREGLSTEEVLQALRKELRSLEAGEATPAPVLTAEPTGRGLRQLVRELEDRWVITPQPFTSRLPLVGELVAGFRTLWNEVSTRWYVQPLVEQQVEFNGSVLRLARITANALDALEDEAVHRLGESASLDHLRVSLSRSAAELEVALRKLEAGLKRLQEREAEQAMAELRGRLARQEQDLADLRARMLAREAPALEAPSRSPVMPAPPMDYLGFEARFRGSSDDIRERQRPYLEEFGGGGLVLDLGCGRGEFLTLLAEAGIPAQGVDSDAGMVAACKDRGLTVVEGDLLGFLEAQQDGSIGGVFSAQVIEHLPPEAVRRTLFVAYQKLRRGGTFLAETINPRSLLALSHQFLLDPSHKRPVHPEALAFLAESYGYAPVDIRYCSAVPEQARLQPVSPEEGSAGWAAVLNRNLETLNEFLYGYQDYALIARKP